MAAKRLLPCCIWQCLPYNKRLASTCRVSQSSTAIVDRQRLSPFTICSPIACRRSRNNIWNLRIHESLLAAKKALSSLTSIVKTNSFVSTLDRSKLHPVIAQYLCHSAIHLLVEYEQWFEEWSLHNFVDSLQARVICLNELRIVELKPWWLDEVTVTADKKIKECVAQVFLLH